MPKNKNLIALYLIIVALFIVLSADFYLSKNDYAPSSDAFLDKPMQYAGQYAEFAGSVMNITAESFYMRVNQKPLKIHYSGLKKPKFGQVYVWAKLNADGTVKGLEVHNLSYNYAKYIVSFFAFIIFLFIFFNEWKLKRLRFVENA